MKVKIKDKDGIAKQWRGKVVVINKHPVHSLLFEFYDDVKRETWLLSEYGIDEILEE